jgi:hypothetical protein
MYGLKHAAVLAYNHLVRHLATSGYHPCPFTNRLWKHHTHRTKFCLCVDDFSIKDYSKTDADHLLDALRRQYIISPDWHGTNYCGLTLKWKYALGYVDISMPGYVKKALDCLQHSTPTRPQYAPHRWTQPAYG